MQREESATSLSPCICRIIPKSIHRPRWAGLGVPGSYLGLELIFRAARDQTKGAGGGPLPLSPPTPIPKLPSPLEEATTVRD